MFWVHIDIWIVVFICKKHKDTGSSTWYIVVSKFKWKKVQLIILLVFVVNIKVLFQYLFQYMIGVFYLAISLMMVSRGKMKSHVKNSF